MLISVNASDHFILYYLFCLQQKAPCIYIAVSLFAPRINFLKTSHFNMLPNFSYSNE